MLHARLQDAPSRLQIVMQDALPGCLTVWIFGKVHDNVNPLKCFSPTTGNYSVFRADAGSVIIFPRSATVAVRPEAGRRSMRCRSYDPVSSSTSSRPIRPAAPVMSTRSIGCFDMIKRSSKVRKPWHDDAARALITHDGFPSFEDVLVGRWVLSSACYTADPREHRCRPSAR